jgi:hypothetical protein
MSSSTKDWYIRQGYAKNHPVHSGTSEFVTSPAFAREAEAEAETEPAEQQLTQQLGGLIPLCTDAIPARTSDPGRPRTLAHGYDLDSNTLRVDFREGAIYYYYGVSPAEHQQYHKSASPGKWLNRRLAGRPYGRVE